MPPQRRVLAGDSSRGRPKSCEGPRQALVAAIIFDASSPDRALISKGLRPEGEAKGAHAQVRTVP